MTFGSKEDHMINIIRNIIKSKPLLSICIMGVLVLIGCENDMKDINAIEKISKEEAVDISKDVKIIMSDSAIVKAVLTGPEMRVYHDTSGNRDSNYEFQKGLTIVFYDKNVQEMQRITSDYGKYKSVEKITEFKKNVVITRADGSVIKTEELYYDENNKTVYNSVPITFQMKDGRGDFQATSFTSDVDFTRIEGQNITGFYITSGSNQFPLFGR